MKNGLAIFEPDNLKAATQAADFCKHGGAIALTVKCFANYEIDRDYGADADGNRGVRSESLCVNVLVLEGTENVTRLVKALNPDLLEQFEQDARAMAERKIDSFKEEGAA